MRIEDARKMLFSDTLIPDVFISEYMATLSGTAVKIYIYALHVSRHHESISDTELARRLETDLDGVKAAIFDLSQKNLLSYDSQKKTIRINDITEEEIARYYRPRTSSSPAEVVERTNSQPRRDKLISEVNKSFFHGMMGYSWYQAIDEWFEVYHFEPEVVYALFNECASRNKLSNKNYISTVAKDWSEKGVSSYQDLNRYYASREKFQKIRNEIGRKLRKNMSEYDDKVVMKWVHDYGYDMPVIEIALQHAVRLGQANMNYFDKMITEWYQAKLKTPADVQTYEENSKERRMSERAAAKPQSTGTYDAGRGRYGNLGNFDQREYSDEFFESVNYDLFEEEIGEKGRSAGEEEVEGGQHVS